MANFPQLKTGFLRGQFGFQALDWELLQQVFSKPRTEVGMTTNLVNEAGEFKAWRWLRQVDVLSAAVGLVVGPGLGAADDVPAGPDKERQ